MNKPKRAQDISGFAAAFDAGSRRSCAPQQGSASDRFFDCDPRESNPSQREMIDGGRDHADLFFLWDDDEGYRILPGDASFLGAAP